MEVADDGADGGWVEEGEDGDVWGRAIVELEAEEEEEVAEEEEEEKAEEEEEEKAEEEEDEEMTERGEEER